MMEEEKKASVKLDNTIQAFLCQAIHENQIPERIKLFRMIASLQLQRNLRVLLKEGFRPDLVLRIAEKKIAMLHEATSKAQVESILHPPAPYFNGVKFYSSQYLTPEEELIAWSMASEVVPLNHWGQMRFEELFSEILPQVAKSIRNRPVK